MKFFLICLVCFVLFSSIAFAGLLGGDTYIIMKRGTGDSNVLFACASGQAVQDFNNGVYHCVAVSGGNPFDQNLSTTDSPSFTGLTVNGYSVAGENGGYAVNTVTGDTLNAGTCDSAGTAGYADTAGTAGYSTTSGTADVVTNLTGHNNSELINDNNTLTGGGVSGRIPYYSGTTTLTNDLNLIFNDTNDWIGANGLMVGDASNNPALNTTVPFTHADGATQYKPGIILWNKNSYSGLYGGQDNLDANNAQQFGINIKSPNINIEQDGSILSAFYNHLGTYTINYGGGLSGLQAPSDIAFYAMPPASILGAVARKIFYIKTGTNWKTQYLFSDYNISSASPASNNSFTVRQVGQASDNSMINGFYDMNVAKGVSNTLRVGFATTGNNAYGAFDIVANKETTWTATAGTRDSNLGLYVYKAGIAVPMITADSNQRTYFYNDLNVSGAITGQDINAKGNLTVTGNATATNFIGNGSQLTGIIIPADTNWETGWTTFDNNLKAQYRKYTIDLNTTKNVNADGNMKTTCITLSDNNRFCSKADLNFAGGGVGLTVPGDSNKQIQYNKGGVFGGTTAMWWEVTGSATPGLILQATNDGGERIRVLDEYGSEETTIGAGNINLHGGTLNDTAYINDNAGTPLTSIRTGARQLMQADGDTVAIDWTTTAGSANHVTCWKADGVTLGYCSSIVGIDGTCTCN